MPEERCERAGKNMFASAKQAEREMKCTKRLSPRPLEKAIGRPAPYLCDYCQHWHWGHKKNAKFNLTTSPI